MVTLHMHGRLTIGEQQIKEIVSTVTSKGQVTIPAEVRRHLGVAQGDKLSFVISDGGEVALKTPQYPTVVSLRGTPVALAEDLGFDEMKEIAYEDRLAEKYQPKV